MTDETRYVMQNKDRPMTTIMLNATDWEAFIGVLENPPEPSAELKKAWCAYHAENDADTES
ncbi:MAG: DUF1778 domain-containing protein [Thiothrix litoralis]|uniref:type II toxin -antitoxin system TacA 1-like antitoxin n=1 Tax=Thiothrix litoralis TaxID=2891210 RepID=UPI003C70EB98